MIPASNTNNKSPVNVRPNTEATQQGQASTNTISTTTNWNNSFTAISIPKPRNKLANTFAKFALGISIFSRFIMSTTASAINTNIPSFTGESNSTVIVNSNNIADDNQTIQEIFSYITMGVVACICLGGGAYLALPLIKKYQELRTVERTQRAITEENNRLELLIKTFCELEYENLAVYEIGIAELKDTTCNVCLAHIDNNASLTNLRSIGSNESMATEEEWVIYKKQLYHLNELQEAVAIRKKVPHTQEEPEISELKAVKILYKPNDTTIEIAESTAPPPPESFIVDIPENQDTSQFTENDNDEESTAFLETAILGSAHKSVSYVKI